MTNYETSGKELLYELVDPRNQQQIEYASLQEREGFSTGIDPLELPEVMSYIAENGHIWLQYVFEEGRKNPTGVIEFIPLENVLKFNPNEIKAEDDINNSSFKIIAENHGRAFSDARKFADDKDIIYHHGIAMSRRGRGYGTMLIRHALDNTPKARDSFISCYIDVAQKNESGELKFSPNEPSYGLHMKNGFRVIGVVDPPVYDDSITYLSFLRPADSKLFRLDGYEPRKLRIDSPKAQQTTDDIRDLTSHGYVGTAYDRNTREMTFVKLK